MRMFRAVRRAVALATLAIPLAAGCGPNLRSVYESSYEWDRCRTLDDDPGVTNEDRLQCWTAWLESDTSGQPPDRIQHARTRVAALGNGGRAAPPSSGGVQAEAPRAPSVASGAPASTASEPTPPTVTAGGVARADTSAPPQSGGNEPAGADGGAGAPPGAGCASTCRSAWNSCSGACGAGDAACAANCDNSYRDCMRGCY
jgi:hypothetical protein